MSYSNYNQLFNFFEFHYILLFECGMRLPFIHISPDLVIVPSTNWQRNLKTDEIVFQCFGSKTKPISLHHRNWSKKCTIKTVFLFVFDLNRIFLFITKWITFSNLRYAGKKYSLFGHFPLLHLLFHFDFQKQEIHFFCFIYLFLLFFCQKSNGFFIISIFSIDCF